MRLTSRKYFTFTWLIQVNDPTRSIQSKLETVLAHVRTVKVFVLDGHRNKRTLKQTQLVNIGPDCYIIQFKQLDSQLKKLKRNFIQTKKKTICVPSNKGNYTVQP